MAEPRMTADAPAAPVVSPAGLLSVSAIVEATRPVVYGVEVAADSVGGHGLWEQPVCAPGDARKTGGEGEALTTFPGTTVWAAEGCKAVANPEAEATAAARRRLTAVESSELEKFTAGVLADRTDDTVGDVATAEARLLAEGIQPVLHVRPSDVPRLIRSKVLLPVSGQVRTILGSRVAIGAGYETAIPAGTMYLTGPVTIYRNSMDVAAAFDQATNARLVVAERSSAVTWYGPTIRVQTEGE